MASITSLQRGIEDQLNRMIENANRVPGYLDRVVYRQYQNAQRERWASENNSVDFMGGQWAALDPAYEAYKRRKYADAPGAGTKILIRTGKLFDSVLGPTTSNLGTDGTDYHTKVVTDRALIVETLVPYAKYVDEKRTFSLWSPVFKNRVMEGLSKYLLKSIVEAVQ